MHVCSTPTFIPLEACWVCGDRRLVCVHRGVYDLSAYREQDPELAAYTGSPLRLRRCRRCGFAQPEALPGLPRYFERMYDQRWSDEWIAREFASQCKTLIFRDVLRGLDRRVLPGGRALLDIGAHVGLFMQLAQQRGWEVQGVELNPRTAAYAARQTGAPVYQANADALRLAGCRFDAVAMIDVLEHIPDPLRMLAAAGRFLKPGGWIALKVPNGPGQLLKERLRGALRAGYRPTVADNLVHVNHFSARSLVWVLKRSDFAQITVTAAAPELAEPDARGMRPRAADALKLALFRLGRAVPGGSSLPCTFNLLAYARRR